MRILFSATLLFVFLLSGCGFKPIYSDHYNGDDVKKIASIKFQKIETRPKYSRITYALNNAIEDVISIAESKYETNDKKYILVVDYQVDISDYLIKADTTPSRKKITMLLKYQVLNIGDGQAVIDGKIVSYDSFHISHSPFSSYLTEEEVSARIAVELVQELKLQLFSRL